jgi:hypothetical protein
LRKFINSVVSYTDIEDVINEFEVRFASILKAAGLNCEPMFAATDARDPTTYHWKPLLQSGFPFVKVKTIRDGFAGVDISDWRQLLATEGYDVSLAERTLAEFSTSSAVGAGGVSGESVLSSGSSRPQSNVLTEDERVMRRLGLKRKRPSAITLADRARDAREWELAAQFYRKAIDQNPRNPPIWVQYGHVLKEAGELRDPDKLAGAEIAYRTALSLDPGAADPYLHLGHVLKLRGKRNEAEASYLRAFALDPAMPYPLQELGGFGWSEAEMAELRHLVNGGHVHAISPARNTMHSRPDPLGASQ